MPVNSPRQFFVSGNSMWPFFKAGDALLVEPLASLPERGDVIVFKLGAILICHRFFKVEQNGGTRLLKTRGDARFLFDIPVEPSAVLGKVVAVKTSSARTKINQKLGQALTQWFGFRDAAIHRLGLRPGSLAFAFLYMAMAPWLFWMPKSPYSKSTE